MRRRPTDGIHSQAVAEGHLRMISFVPARAERSHKTKEACA